MASRLALPVVFAVTVCSNWRPSANKHMVDQTAVLVYVLPIRGGEAILDYVGDENRILYWAILVRCKKRNGAEALIILYSRLGFSCYRRERQRSQGADHYSPIDAVYSRRSFSKASERCKSTAKTTPGSLSTAVMRVQSFEAPSAPDPDAAFDFSSQVVSEVHPTASPKQ
ncbi:hypothetical protein L1987_89525 [Smallanthus sonchifolius]|nr:hypothetical protein L1987_89525 [Smallanthus sonchifolius]